MTPLDIASGITGITTAGINAGGNLITNLLNYNLQKKQFAYQQDLQKQIFAREDNAIQRQVKDLKAAGLSPTLAAGGGANAGSVVSTSAPQMNWSDVSLGSAFDYMKSMQQVEMNEQQKIANEKQIAFTAAQINNMNAQTTKLNIDNGFESQLKSALLNQILSQTAHTDAQKDKIEFDLEKARRLVENEIKLSNQAVLHGNMMNWNQGYNNYFLQNYGFEPSKLTSLFGTALNTLVKTGDNVRRGIDSEYNESYDGYYRPGFKMY